MDSKLQPVLLYGFSKSRLYEPLGTAIFFRNRFCPVSWILVFFLSIFMGTVYEALLTGKNGVCHQWKNKKISELKKPGKP